MRDLVRSRGLGLCLADLLAHRIEVVEVTEVGHTAQQLHRLFLMRLYLLGFGIHFKPKNPLTPSSTTSSARINTAHGQMRCLLRGILAA